MMGEAPPYLTRAIFQMYLLSYCWLFYRMNCMNTTKGGLKPWNPWEDCFSS